jgi:hypothetical protein
MYAKLGSKKVAKNLAINKTKIIQIENHIGTSDRSIE